MAYSDSLVGKHLGGYEILRELGRGGMGVVYKAHEQTLQPVVALKVLSPRLAESPAFVARFQREARSAASLSHPSIVTIHAVGQSDGVHYIAMEYIRGRSLAEHLGEKGMLGPDEALGILKQVAEALDEAHRAGIIHRDIKPQNIMIDAAGRVKVMDFGLAKAMESTSHLTQAGASLGTPQYMAPEQIEGRKTDGRADLFALGIVLYEMLTGHAPFEADTPMAVMYQIKHEPLPQLDALKRAMPKGVLKLLAAMTEKEPGRRIDSAMGVLGQVEALYRSGAVQSAEGKERPAAPGSFADRWARLRKSPTRLIRKPLVAGLLAVCLAGSALAALIGLSANYSEPAAGDTETIMLPGAVRLEMVWIPSGTFMMGRYPGEQDSESAEDPQHQVTLAQGFWVGEYELTKAQWTAVMGTTPWTGQDYVLNDPDSPAVYVSWNDAQAFLTALNSLTGQTFRLPSEAEWEYACRAGTTTCFYWGDDPNYTVGNDYAWWAHNALDVNEQYAHVVGQKLPNAWGLYDLSGNVWEWCQDWYHSGYSGAPADDSAWESPTGSCRVLRGGPWGSSVGFHSRSARRGDGGSPYLTGHHFGFRVVRTP